MKNVRREEQAKGVCFLVRFERKNAKGERVIDCRRRFHSSEYGGIKAAKKAAYEFAEQMHEKRRQTRPEKVYHHPSKRNKSGVVGLHDAQVKGSVRPGGKRTINNYWIAHKWVSTPNGVVKVRKSFRYEPSEKGSKEKMKAAAIRWMKKK